MQCVQSVGDTYAMLRFAICRKFRFERCEFLPEDIPSGTHDAFVRCIEIALKFTIRRMKIKKRNAHALTPQGPDKIIVVTVVVGFVIAIRGEDQAYRSGGKIVQLAPDHGTDVKSVIGAVQMKAFLFAAVIQYDIEAAGHGNDQLVQLPVRMTASLSTARYVIEIIDALNAKRDMCLSFNECEVAAGVGYFGQVNYSAVC